MKKNILSIVVLISVSFSAQTWNTTGNSGTTPTTNFLGTTDNQDLVLKTNSTERIRVLSTGSVGINKVPNNSLSLDVNGSAGIYGNATNKDVLNVQNNLDNNDAGIDLLFLRYNKYQPNNPSVMTVSGMTTPTKYEAFFNLRANGKLGLSTYNFQNCSDCANYRLFVKDGIKAEKVKVDIASANGWADYVFKNGYQLQTLEEVEKHITEKGHLPNVPSAEEVAKNGINVAEMDAKLLEKIEELTLYSIEQNKQIKIQQEQIKQLEVQNKELLELKKMVQELKKEKNK